MANASKRKNAHIPAMMASFKLGERGKFLCGEIRMDMVYLHLGDDLQSPVSAANS
jgi:hypothetical protein